MRPCVIIQNDIGNAYSPNLIVAPLTTHLKRTEMKVHVVVDEGLPEKSMVLCEQILTVSKECVSRYIGKLSPETLQKVNVALLYSLGIL